MANKYLKGTIFNLYEDSDERFLVVSNIEIDEEQFLLTMPVEDITNIEIDANKLFLLKVSKNDEVTIETNREITERVIKETIEREQKREDKLKNT